MFMRRFPRGFSAANSRLADLICRIRKLRRKARLRVELLENRACPALLGLAGISINPDIASGARTTLSMNDLGNNANPFEYDSIPLALTASNGARYAISNPTGGAASTTMNVILTNTGLFAPSTTSDNFSISGKVTFNNTTFSGTLLSGVVTNFGFSNPTYADTEFDVLLVVTGGILTQQQNPAGIYQVGDQLGMLIHQSGLTITHFPQTFSLKSFTGSSDTKTIQTTISGSKFEDLNADGVQEPGEPGLPNWGIALYTDTSGVVSSSPIATTTTDAQGDYSFTKLGPLPADTEYVVSEIQQTGWMQTAPGPSSNTILLPNGLFGYVDPAIAGAVYTQRSLATSHRSQS